MILIASNGQAAYSANTVALGTGSQTISLQFAAADLISLGVDGPYEKTQAYLALVNGYTSTAADLNADVGPPALTRSRTLIAVRSTSPARTRPLVSSPAQVPPMICSRSRSGSLTLHSASARGALR